MNLKDFALLREDHESYTVGHPKGKSIRVPKRGLSDQAQTLISKLKREQHFYDGSEEISEPPPQLTERAVEPQPDAQVQEPDAIANISADAEKAASNAQQEMKEHQEISELPPPVSQVAPPQAPQTPGAPTNMNDALVTARKGVLAGIGSEAAGHALVAKANENAAGKLNDLIQDSQLRMDDLQKKDQTFYNALKNQTPIDQNRWWNSKSTPSKISAAIGVFLGGLGAGLTHTENPVLGMINKAIDQDIESQKNDHSNHMTLYKLNREGMQNENAATLASMNQYLTVAKVQAEQGAAKMQSGEAKQRAAQLVMGLDQQISNNNRTMSLMGLTPQGKPLQTQQAGQPSKTDPALLVPQVVPKEHQARAFETLQGIQETKRAEKTIMNAFDEAVRDTQGSGRLTSFVKEPRSVGALHSALGPTFKTVEGTVRQAAMDNMFKTTTPNHYDSDEDTATKRNALKNYIQSNMDSPVLKAYGIDPRKYESTSLGTGGAYPPGSVVNIKGKQYEVQADGNALKPL